MSIVTTDGSLTTAGYVLCTVFVLVLLLFASCALGKPTAGKKLSTKQLVFCAAAMALGFVTSYIKVGPELPFGGSVTLMSMLFVCLIGYWYGPWVGVFTGLAYGILQFLQSPYVLSTYMNSLY